MLEAMSGKMGATKNDIMIGTPEMFRGVEKDLIILCPLRNSQVEGLGEF